MERNSVNSQQAKESAHNTDQKDKTRRRDLGKPRWLLYLFLSYLFIILL